MCWLMVDSATFRRAVARAKPPASTTTMNTRNNRRSMSLTRPIILILGKL
jgi:hypothetical protein